MSLPKIQQQPDDKYISSTIEKMIINGTFCDTILVCSDGKMQVNRLTVGLLFPHLKSCDILQFPVENVVMLPDFPLNDINSQITINLRKNDDCCSTEDIIDNIKKEVEVEGDVGEGVNYYHELQNDVKEDFNNYEMLDNDSNEYSDISDEDYTPNPTQKSKKHKKIPVFAVKLDDLKFDLEVANTKYETLFQNIKEASTKVHIDGVEKVKCSSCKEVVAKLSTHVARKHSDMDFKCPYCTFCTGNFSLLKSHLNKHFTYSKEPHDIEKLDCSICFKKVINLKEHINLVHERKLIHNCPNCEKAFPNKSQLKKHIASHIGLKEICPICSKEIAARHLKEHIREVHEKIKNHCCPECGMAFFARRALEKHMRTHTKEKTICAHCGKAVANIVNHMKVVHSGRDRQVVCPHCGVKVIQLKEHIKEVHEKVVRFSCPDCDFKCYKRDVINTHLKAHAKGTQGKYRPTGFGRTRDLGKNKLKKAEADNSVLGVLAVEHDMEVDYKKGAFGLANSGHDIDMEASSL